jgi:hypothetical protein
MKFSLRLSAFCLIAFPVFFFTGCNNAKVNYKNPESVAMAYAKALNALDIDKAKRYCTKGTAEMLGMLGAIIDGLGADEKKEMEAKAKTTKVEKMNCVKESNTNCTCSYTTSDNEGEETQILLVLEGDKWLVDIPKEESPEGEEQPD